MPSQPFEQADLSVIGSRFEVDGEHRFQTGEETGLDEGRLAAAARAVDHSHGEGPIRSGLLDASLPEVDALGQPVRMAGAGEKLEEEVGVVLVEGPQALGDDLDKLLLSQCGPRSVPQRTESAQFGPSLRRDYRFQSIRLLYPEEVDKPLFLQVAKMVANILLEHLGMLGDIGIEYATILIVGQFLTCPEYDKRGWFHGAMQ